MKITPPFLRRVTDTILATLSREGIATTEDLEQRLQERLEVGRIGHTLSIELVPSNFGYAIALSYGIEVTGIPVEVRINRGVGYSVIILKADQLYQGFDPKLNDSYGNIIQMKRLPGIDLAMIIDELQRVGKLTESV